MHIPLCTSAFIREHNAGRGDFDAWSTLVGRKLTAWKTKTAGPVKPAGI